MIKKIISIFTFIGILTFSTNVSAQKYGYINSQALLLEMPEVKEANSNLATLEQQLKAKGQNMIASLEKKYQAIQAKMGSGELSPLQQEEEGKKFQAEQQKIAAFEQEMMQKIQAKQVELMQPILDKITNAINEIAKEEGYNAIFDASTQVLLYADDNMDISAKVKAKLGL